MTAVNNYCFWAGKRARGRGSRGITDDGPGSRSRDRGPLGVARRGDGASRPGR